jgi:hypothetical protein|tara:strand:- start:193 stop:411 length:219 start_codon:yes stop_codon:yes gene_type:complete
MKFILSLIICSQVMSACLEPYVWPETFDSQYDCLLFGYEESINKMKELGREESSEYGMYVKFYCTPQPGLDS